MDRGTDDVSLLGVPQQDARGGLKTFRCGDVVPGCSAEFEGTEARIIELVGAHALDHGVEVDEEVLGAVRRRIRPA